GIGAEASAAKETRSLAGAEVGVGTGAGVVDVVVEAEVVTLLLASSFFSGGWWSPTCSECPALSLALALLSSLSLLLLFPSASSLLLSSDAQATAVTTSEDSAVDEPSSLMVPSPSSGSASCMVFQ